MGWPQRWQMFWVRRMWAVARRQGRPVRPLDRGTFPSGLRMGVGCWGVDPCNRPPHLLSWVLEVVGMLDRASRRVMVALGVVVSLFLFGVPLLFGFWAAVIGPARGRPGLMAFNLGVWFGPFYVFYLLFGHVKPLEGSVPPPPPGAVPPPPQV